MAGNEGPITVRVDAELQELVPGYLEGRREDLATLSGALAKNDWETVRVVGHTMKGSGGGYGFQEITEIGAAMEMAAIKEDLESARAQVARLADYLARVNVQYV